MVSEGQGDSSAERRAQASGSPPSPPTSVADHRFRPEQHVRRGADFERIYARSCRGSDQHLLIFGDRNGLNWTRIGLSVSKKHGSAVRRNRLKRLLREAFRLSQRDLPVGLDLVLIPRTGVASTLADYRQSLLRSVKYLHRKLPALPTV